MHSSTRTVLVLGARGRFGQAAVQAYAAAGWTVLAQARRAVPADLPPRARALQVDLSDPAALADAARGADTVVHAVNPPYTDWPTQAVPLLRQSLEVSARLGARCLLPGNVYNFGDAMPERLCIDTPQRPSTRKGRIRVAMEELLQAHAARGQASVVLRAGDFFGGGTGSWFDLAITKGLRRGRLVYPGPLDRPHAWAFLPDLARAFVAVSQAPAQPGLERLHFSGFTLTGAQLLAAIEAVAARHALEPAGGWRHGGMPWGWMRAGGVLVPMWREVAEMAYLWRVPHALDGEALERRVGPLPSTPLDEAIAHALQQLGLLPRAPQPALAPRS